MLDTKGLTALMTTCGSHTRTMAMMNRHHICRELLLAKACPDLADMEGRTALHLASLSMLPKKENGAWPCPLAQCAESILHFQPSLDLRDVHGETAIEIALRMSGGSQCDMVDLLERARWSRSSPALVVAVHERDAEAVSKMLATVSCDVNQRDTLGRTALMHAVAKTQWSPQPEDPTLEALLDAGADVHQADRLDFSASRLYLAKFGFSDREIGIRFDCVIGHPRPEVRPFAKNTTGWTALHYAAIWGNFPATSRLLRAGAQVKCFSASKSPLDLVRRTLADLRETALTIAHDPCWEKVITLLEQSEADEADRAMALLLAAEDAEGAQTTARQSKNAKKKAAKQKGAAAESAGAVENAAEAVKVAAVVSEVELEEARVVWLADHSSWPGLGSYFHAGMAWNEALRRRARNLSPDETKDLATSTLKLYVEIVKEVREESAQKEAAAEERARAQRGKARAQADKCLQRAMTAHEREALSKAIESANGVASANLLAEARSMRDKLRSEKKQEAKQARRLAAAVHDMASNFEVSTALEEHAHAPVTLPESSRESSNHSLASTAPSTAGVLPPAPPHTVASDEQSATVATASAQPALTLADVGNITGRDD
eukprot:6069504-Prymnesium_polylepis.1